MIHLMLNDLCRLAGIGFHPCLHLLGLILHLDSFIPLALAGTSEKRQTPLFGVIRIILFDDFGIEHHGVYRSSSALIKKRDDSFFHADHIRRHTDTGFLVRHQCVEQVLRDKRLDFVKTAIAPFCLQIANSVK